MEGVIASLPSLATKGVTSKLGMSTEEESSGREKQDNQSSRLGQIETRNEWTTLNSFVTTEDFGSQNISDSQACYSSAGAVRGLAVDHFTDSCQ